MIQRLSIAVLTLAVLLCGAAPLRAQVSNLDQTTLIEALRKEGMGDLLKHLAQQLQSDPSIPPEVGRQVLINQLLLDYAEKFEAAQKLLTTGRPADREAGEALREEAIAAFMRAADERRNLIQTMRDHDQRPIWQTDLAEQLLYDYLGKVRLSAAEFYEVGVPTQEQREAFETATVQALEQLDEAMLRFFTLQGDLPRQPDHVTKRINTGLWDRMMKQNYELRTPYLLATAALYVALLPDEHPYYRSLGRNTSVQRQAATPTQERDRLLTIVQERLERYVSDANDNEGIRFPSMSMTGRALVRQNNLQEGVALLDQVIARNTGSLEDLVARLTKAFALDRAGQTADAMEMISAARDHPMARQELLVRLLVIDAEHRILLRTAESRPAAERAAAMEVAYEPYARLLTDAKLAEQAAGLRSYIYRRWEANIPPGRDLSDVPAVVVAAVGETTREAGQILIEQADAADDAGEADRATQLRAAAMPKLDRSMQVNTVLLKRENLAPAIRAQGMFNLAFATYYKDSKNLDSWIAAAQTLTDLADQMPDQPIAETALRDALFLLQQIHRTPPLPPGVAEGYERAAQVALTKYPSSTVTDDERYYYAAAVLAPAGRWADVVKIVKPLPLAHPNYFFAQQMLVVAMQQMYRQAEESQKKELGQQVVAEATRLMGEADREMGGTDARAEGAKLAAGWSRLVLADMSVELNNSLEDALHILIDFDRLFAGEEDLIRRMLEKRIVMLFRVDKFEDAVAEAERMMGAFPADAAIVVERVLTDVSAQIESLRQRAASPVIAQADRDRLNKEAHDKSVASLKLADLLLAWARQQKFEEEDALLPYELLVVRANILTDDLEKAQQLIQPLEAQHANNADVIHQAAELRFARANKIRNVDKAASNALLIESAAMYDQLIAGLDSKQALWWNAWMRRLQGLDIMGENVGDISLRIRQLESSDPNLGGEPYKSELKRLQVKHTR